MTKVYHYIGINDVPNILNYSVLSCAFFAFSVYTFQNALKVSENDDDLKTTASLYKSPARLGYGLMVVSFLITIILSFSKGEPLYFRYFVAISGFVCLAFKIDIGIFIIIVSNMLSLIYAAKITTIDYIYAVSKTVLILYYATYGYRYATLQGNSGKKISKKLE